MANQFIRSDGDQAKPTCWSCSCPLHRALFFCPKCEKIQPVQTDSPFALLGLKPQFQVSEADLERAYFEVQTLIHPDKFVTKSPIEKENASEQSIAINNAYQSLKDSYARAMALLEENNMDPGTVAESSNNPDLLAEMMALKEDLMECQSVDDYEAFGQKIIKLCQNCQQNLALAFDQSNYQEAAKMSQRLRYIQRLLTDWKQALKKG